MQTRQTNLITIAAIMLFIFGWISVNIYLPALPSLSHDLHTDPQQLKFSITLFLLGFAIAQLIWGPISEKYGRRLPIILGLVLTCIGIVIAMLAVNVMMFNAGRFIEAIGLGCAPVLGRAALIDVLDAKEFSSAMTYGTISSNLMPALAPIIGGYILLSFGWRYIFAFLLVYGLTIFTIIITKFPETHAGRNAKLKILSTFSHYTEALTHKKFIGFLTPYMLVTGGMIGYYTVTPFIFINQLHMSASTYGYLSLITVATYILGASASRVLSGRVPIAALVVLGELLLIIAVLVLIINAIFFGLGIATIIIPMAIYTLGAGIICPNSNAGAMHALRHKAGAAAAVVGFSLYLASAILSTIITALPMHSLWPLTIYMLSITAISIFVFRIFVLQKHKEVAANEPNF